VWHAQGATRRTVDTAVLEANAAAWEKQILVEALDGLWVDYSSDTENLQLNVMMRSFTGMTPIDEFRLEAGA
jgi:hypothetical protein